MKKKSSIHSEYKFIITPQGSLGLLAYGDLGLEAWRKVKMDAEKKNSSK